MSKQSFKKRSVTHTKGRVVSSVTECPKLIGKGSIVDISIGNVPARGLLDTGSMITTVSEDFYSRNLASYDILPMSSSLKVTGATGQSLSLLGYIEVQLCFPNLQHKQITHTALVVVVPNTEYNSQIPVLLGTNVLGDCVNSSQHLLVTTRAEVVSAGSCKKISGITRGNMECSGQLLMSDVSDLCTLPGGVRIVPSVTDIKQNPSPKTTTRIAVTIQNLTSKSVVIPCKSVVCSLQHVNLANIEESAVVSDYVQQVVAKDQSPESFLKHFQLDEVDSQVKGSLSSLLLNWKHLFAFSDLELGNTGCTKHRIDLTDDTPIKERHRRIPPTLYSEVRDCLADMLDSGVIRPSSSAWASPMVLVRKSDGSLRMCIDYRGINRVTKKDAYALPRIEETLDTLGGAKYFSCIDLKSGYWQVEVEEAHKERTAFTAGPLGFFEFNKMPFGLCNSPATFQRLMERCLNGLNLEQCLIYLDDIVIFSSTIEEHFSRLDSVFRRLTDYGLKLKPSKCQFLKTKIKYLGYIVSEQGVEIDPEKVESVKSMSPPTNIVELQRFLGFASFHRRFISQFAKTAKPLTDLLVGQSGRKKSKKRKPRPVTKFQWGPLQQRAFEELIQAIIQTPILAFVDYSLPFELHVDASLQGLGAVLFQSQDGVKRPVAYASRTLSKSEQNYPAHKLEFLALKWSVTEKFFDYLYGNRFHVMTDNNPLTYILTSAKLDATGHRWLSALSAFDFSISYKPGIDNVAADMMSRLPRKEHSVEEVKAILQSPLVEEGYVHGLCLSQEVIRVFEQTEGSIVERLNVKSHQQSDKTIRRVTDLLRTGTKPSNKDINKENAGTAKLLRQWDKLVTQNGLLYRVTNRGQGQVRQLVIPVSLKSQILESLHDDMGHVGRDRTMDLVQSRFYWPFMTRDIEDKVGNCRRCQCRKSPMQQAPLVSIVCTQPMELVCLDYLTVEPSQGYENILVITDHFSKFSQAYATKNQSAKTTAKVLYDHFIVHYGAPAKLHSDQGKNFLSKVIKELCSILGIEKSRTSVYHPMGNGACERYNRSLLNMLGTMENDKKRSWKQYLGHITHAYNCTKHSITGFSPYKLMFGREPLLPVDIQFGAALHEGTQGSYTEFAKDLKKRLSYAWDLAKSNQTLRSGKQKVRYDVKQRGAVLEIGDRVLIRKVGLKGRHKLADKWEESPWVVRKVYENIPVYEVVPEKGGKGKVLHRNLLLPIGGDKVNVMCPNHEKPVQKKKEKTVSGNDDVKSRDVRESSSDDEIVVQIRKKPNERTDLDVNESDSNDSDVSVNENGMNDTESDVSENSSQESIEHVEMQSPVQEPRRGGRVRQQTKMYTNDRWQMSQQLKSPEKFVSMDDQMLKPEWIRKAEYLLKVIENPSVKQNETLLNAIVNIVK